jgi:SAM-dependent methyltransferase
MTEQNNSQESGVYSRMTADVYDAIYSKKNYESEAAVLKSLVQQYKRTDGNELLDVACGTGLHLPYLADDFQITGIDLSEAQLSGARLRLPQVDFKQGDMRNFRLHRKFDVVTCLFSSIGYMQSEVDMNQAISNMADHLKPGGVLFIEPWLQPIAFDPNRPPHTEVGELPEKHIKVTRTARNSLEGHISVLNMHNVVETPQGTEEFTEVHRLAMYPAEIYQEAIKSSGLSPHYDEQGLSGRGLHFGVKKPL